MGSNSTILFGSECLFVPLTGKRKAIKLNRKTLEFISDSEETGKKKSYQIPVDTLGGSIHLRISFCEKKRSFSLLNLSSERVTVNGREIIQCGLEKGDQIIFSGNLLKVIGPNIPTQEHFIPPRVLSSDISILIEGETGVGKTHLAKQIHKNSERVGRFIHLNLSSLSQNLIESEIFGHVKGAFTGADSDHRGAIVEAQNGTLFLDEINSLDLAQQVKLLNFLDDKTIKAVGDRRFRKVETRVIFASNADLKRLVKEGKFREDLYYRVTSGWISLIEPLRKNKRKIIEFIESFESKNFVVFSPELKNLYLEYSWPGNYRELIGHLNRKAFERNGSYIRFSQLDRRLTKNLEVFEQLSLSEYPSLLEVKKAYVKETFLRVRGDKRLAARILQVAEQTVANILQYQVA